MLSASAVTTQNIRPGGGGQQIPARQPTTAASATSTIDQRSNGRAMLGLGLSGPQVSERLVRGAVPSHRWAGPGSTSISSAWHSAREKVEYHGKHFHPPVEDAGLGPGNH